MGVWALRVHQARGMLRNVRVPSQCVLYTRQRTGMAIATQESTSSLLITGVQWETYEALLADVGERLAPRLTYDHGVLEIGVPSFSHAQLRCTRSCHSCRAGAAH